MGDSVFFGVVVFVRGLFLVGRSVRRGSELVLDFDCEHMTQFGGG